MSEAIKSLRGSRRERPAKPPLTREGTITAALKILREEGLGKVTMRRIASELDTGAASLYVYVRNTEDLHAQILDALLTPAAASLPAQGNWRDQVKNLLGRYAGVLFEYPDIARMAMSTMPSGPHYMALVEAILAALRRGGVSDGQAAWAVDLLLLYVTAQAAEKAAWKSSGKGPEQFSEITRAIETADPAIYPNIVALGALLLGGGRDRFEWGLDVLINGVLQTAWKGKS